MSNMMGIVVIAIYIVFFAIMWLIAMIPAVINSIGLARICKKLGAFKPLWCWVWAFLCPPIALLRAGDDAAEKVTPYGARRYFGTGLTSVLISAFLIAIVACLGLLVPFSAGDPQISAFTKLLLIAIVVLLVLVMAMWIWTIVLLYISYFRIFKLYVPTWGAWLMIAGMILLSQFSFLLLPILSFLPMKE